MESYLADERFALGTTVLPGDPNRVGISGHSMGGHGALVLAQRNRDQFRSVSALAPIAAPTRAPWGAKAFSGSLGPDRQDWAAYGASLLTASSHNPFPDGILVDQGLADGDRKSTRLNSSH